MTIDPILSASLLALFNAVVVAVAAKVTLHSRNVLAKTTKQALEEQAKTVERHTQEQTSKVLEAVAKNTELTQEGTKISSGAHDAANSINDKILRVNHEILQVNGRVDVAVKQMAEAVARIDVLRIDAAINRIDAILLVHAASIAGLDKRVG